MIQRALFALVAVTALFSSCISDLSEGPKQGGGEKDNFAVLSFDPRFSAHQTRAEWWGDGNTDPFPRGNQADSLISTFRVLVFNHTTGDIVQPAGENPWDFTFQISNDVKPPFRITVPAGLTSYDFVFIANPNTPVTVDASPVSYANIDDLNDLAIDYPDDIAGNVNIPMVRVYSDVKVVDSQKITIGGVEHSIADNWHVDMVRAAIRLSLEVKMSESKYAAWKKYHSSDAYPFITIDGLRTRSRLMPSTDNYGLGMPLSRRIPVFEVKPATVDAAFAAQVAAGEYGIAKKNADGLIEIRVDRLIYPELLFADAGTASKSLKMSIGFDEGAGSEIKTARIFRAPENENDPVTDYTMPRNTWLVVEADTENDLDVITRVLPWNNAGLDNVDGMNYHLTTDRSVVFFPGGGGAETVDVFTDYKDGWKTDLVGAPEWVTSLTPASGAKDATTKLKITVASNGTNEIRRGSFNLVAGNLTKKITLIQLPAGGVVSYDPAPANVTMYVGAFWKANQYGERLIRIPRPTTAPVNAIDGDWAAIVVEGEDWIVLDREMTKDPNVGWRTDVATPDETKVRNGNDSGFDVQYRVNGTETMVGGTVNDLTPQIYFRIGLTSTITPDEHRYGLVLLAYTNSGVTKFHRIFIRQGEEADYLMRPEDTNTTPIPGATGGVYRPMAQKFSPYNITAQDFKDSPAGTDISRIFVGTNGGMFADYPTQAGAFFAWGVSEGIYAYNPISPDTWDSASAGGVWSALYESCPEGYRRPMDGNTSTVEMTTVKLEESEFAQSLLSYAAGGATVRLSVQNSVRGYYADGFFDRKTLTTLTATNKTLNSAVNTGNSSVAYMGRLFFNPETYNSLFLPETGTRRNSPGLHDSSYYFSSSSRSSTVGWTLNLAADGLWRNTAERRYAAPIRCVKTEGSISAEDLTFTYGGGTQNLVVNSTDATGAEADWEVTGYYETDGSGNPVGALKPGVPAWLALNATDNGEENWQPTLTANARELITTNLNTEDQALQNAPEVAPNKSGRYDLSYSYDPALRNTANSYIVNAPGRYKFPLVYGNAIEESKTGASTQNTAAYDTGKPTATTFLGRFVNHDNQPITSPYIAQTVSGELNATLVWMDAPGLVVVNPAIEGSGADACLTFDVPRGNIVQGNAVVAVRDGNGTILWSWHIWVTPVSIVDADAPVYDAVVNRTNYTYNFMKHNLGWQTARTSALSWGDAQRAVLVQITQKSTGKTATMKVTQENSVGGSTTGGNNPYWQWGRKDPMPAGSGISNSERTLFYGTKADGQPYKLAAAVTTLHNVAIQNPVTFYTGNGNWFASNFVNLWSASNAATTANDDNVVKTVYDPSPVGFKMPASNAWTGFSKTDVGPGESGEVNNTAAFNQGRNFYLDQNDTSKGTAFYPASRVRVGTSGNISGSSSSTPDANYWLAIPANNMQGYNLAFGSDNRIAPIFAHIKSHGFSVRPVKDEAPVAPIKPELLAAPGVIGYIKGTNTLTLNGSKEYGFVGSPFLTDPSNPLSGTLATGEPVEDETVYVAHFKFGSLVAIDGKAAGRFAATDVVHRPAGYVTTISGWDDIPDTGDFSGGIVANDNITEELSGMEDEGLGDPCDYYFGDKQGGGWRLPVDFSTDSGWKGSAFSNNYVDDGDWMTRDEMDLISRHLPMGAHTGSSSVDFDGSVFLPAAGGRSADGNGSGESPTAGHYWSSIAASAKVGRAMYFDGNGLFLRNDYGSSFAKAVRCVQEPTKKAGVLAAPGVIGYIHNPGETNHRHLTLNGSKEYDIPPFITTGSTSGTNAPSKATGKPVEKYTVYVAYFQFGSLVAIGSEGGAGTEPANVDHFDKDDIIEVPQEWTGLNDLEKLPVWNNVPSAYNASPLLAAGDNVTEKFVDKEAQGLGDPCDYYFGRTGAPYSGSDSGWKLPTGGEWYKEGGSPFGSLGSYTTNPYWEDADERNSPFDGLLAGKASSLPDWAMFLPAAGLRSKGDNTGGGWTLGQGLGGSYWSSTVVEITTGDIPVGGLGGYSIGFEKTSYSTVNRDNYRDGMAVRCVPGPSYVPSPGEVIVGPIAWAAANVATPGTFAATQYMYDGTNIHSYLENSAAGLPQGVCPDGWRLPTEAEFNALLAASTNGSKTYSNTNGKEFTIGGSTLFLSASGGDMHDGSGNQFIAHVGNYLASDPVVGKPGFVNILQFGASSYASYNAETPNDGTHSDYSISVRCVRDI